MPCIYKYNRNTPNRIQFSNKTLSADGKVEYFSYSIERDLIGNPNHILISQGNAIRYVDTKKGGINYRYVEIFLLFLFLMNVLIHVLHRIQVLNF